jgi:hypothetical protein
LKRLKQAQSTACPSRSIADPVDAIRISVLEHAALRKFCFADRAIDAVRFINLNAAQAIGLTVPQSFLVRGQGDRIINVRDWPLADIAFALQMSAFEGKADITFAGSYVRL